ncbi:hypothetical protein ABZP36_031513 [Zizania latifolia]
MKPSDQHPTAERRYPPPWTRLIAAVSWSCGDARGCRLLVAPWRLPIRSPLFTLRQDSSSSCHGWSQAFVFDFQPREPEDVLAAFAALSQSKIPGVVRRRTLRRVPDTRRWLVVHCDGDGDGDAAVHAADRFSERWPTAARLSRRDYNNDCLNAWAFVDPLFLQSDRAHSEFFRTWSSTTIVGHPASHRFPKNNLHCNPVTFDMMIQMQRRVLAMPINFYQKPERQ